MDIYATHAGMKSFYFCTIKLSREKTSQVKMGNLKHQAGSTCDIEACTWDPKHPIWCSTTSAPFFQNGLPHPSPSLDRGHEPGGLCFVLPKEARPPLSPRDPEVNWTHLARPRPIQLWSFAWDKNISQEQGSLQARGWEDTHTHVHRQRTRSESEAHLCYVVFSQCSMTL